MTSKRRLAAYRATAAKNAEIHTRPHLAGGSGLAATWPLSALGVARQAKAFARQTAGRWSEDRTEYYCDAWPKGWRVIGRADEVCTAEHSRRVDHGGWYTTPDGHDGTLSGYVLQLPSRGGVAQFIAATSHSEWEGVTLFLATRYDSKLDAASAADGEAESAAEEEREYQTAWQAGAKWADKGEEAKAARIEARAILAERRTVKGLDAPALCAAIRSRVESLLDAIREAREARAKLESGDDARLCFYPSDRLVAAFNDGAGRA